MIEIHFPDDADIYVDENGNRFIPITVEVLKEAWEEKDITAPLYLELIFELMQVAGEPVAVPNVVEFCAEWKISQASYYKAMQRLKESGRLEQFNLGAPLVNPPNFTEKSICKKLQQKLGGLTEVVTPSGRIDLLTDEELIEAKHIDWWKNALGQVLVYGTYYPERRKRLHLFYGAGLDPKTQADRFASIVQSCSEFNVSVTFEEVQS